MKQDLPNYIKDNENLQQTLLAQEGFMKYVAEYIINGGDDGLSLYAQYQEHVYADYRKANTWNGDAQLMSVDELWLKALGPTNHLVKEFSYRKAFERSISDLPENAADAAEAARAFYDAYLAYAWRGFFERKHPEHATDVGFYQYFMKQFKNSDGLIYRCMELAIKEHHGKGWTETDQYDYYHIAEYHYFYFDWSTPHGKRAFDRLRRGVKEWIEGKDDKECRELARDMLEKVRFFSQHIYNDDANCGSNGVSFPIEDKRWLRGLVEKKSNERDTDAIWLFRDFLLLLQEVCRIWAARLLKYHNTDLHELEKLVYSFLRPYKQKEDGFDYSYYVDHYYIEDSPNTCCVKNRQEAKELLYGLYDIKEGDNLAKKTDLVEQPKQEEENKKESRNERRGGNGKPPRVTSSPPKYMTLKYVTHTNKELTERQNERVKLLYEKWKTPQVTQTDGGWGWLPAGITHSNFYKLFEGKDRKCELKFKPDMVVLTYFLKCLLKYKIPDGKKKKKLIIEKQKGQSAPQIIKAHFDVNAAYDYTRLSDIDIERIKESIYILDWTAPLPQIPGGGDTDYDKSDIAIQQLSDNIDLGIDLKADVEQAVMSGELRIGKHN